MNDRPASTESGLGIGYSVPNEADVAPPPIESTQRERRPVLVIASRFPPVASVGAIRIRKFAKYLRDFGWEPVIITGAMRSDVQNSHDARRAVDRESLDDLPAGLMVHRLNASLDHWPSHVSRSLGERLGKCTRVVGVPAKRWQEGLKWRLERLHDRLAFPDRGIWRLPTIVRLARKLHKIHRFQAVFSSGMPFSDHLIGLAVKRVLRVPWLADFRDPWVEYIHWKQWTSRWGRSATRRAERAVVRHASCVISVNDHMTDRFRARYAQELPEKFVTIPNGFDPGDFAIGTTPDTPTASQRRFTLLYAGSLYQTRSPVKLIEAFCSFLETTPEAAEFASLEFVGRPGPHVDDLIRRRPDAIRYRGLLPHSTTCRALANATVNVVLLPNLPGSEKDTTAKIYECLGSGRPILAAVPLHGAAAGVLREFDGVSLCDPDDTQAIQSAIATLYGRWRVSDLRLDRSAATLEPHTRRAQARLLAERLSQICPVAAREIAAQ
ncbi:MAG: glycosyltransferase [Phycisphaerales bacterium]|nr:glycosyltransferase [Phycisphaerales bacterium]